MKRKDWLNNVKTKQVKKTSSKKRKIGIVNDLVIKNLNKKFEERL